MKKLGLRAVAGGLAVLMAVAGFAPATASAADTLITAAAPKTLVITADMVDDDGEIVISGENWDRIVIEKEAAAKDIYFDGVEVGELVVESGSESNIQLWEVAAAKVTVKEPELVDLDITEIRNLYSDKETKEQAFDLYMKAREENKKTLAKAPSIVTMDAAVVDSISASGSVKLDVKKGEVKAFTLEASSKVSQMNVTLDGYTGDVTYKGTDKFSVVNFNSVNCEIENLKVEGSASNNYLNVESKNSASANVEVAGNAAVSLNIPITKLEVTEKATAAQVGVLNKVEELNVAANNATVKVGAEAKVVAANVVGNKVSIGGEGKLDNVEITGSDASVSTSGTGIKGENTYRPPAVKEPEKPAVQMGTLPEGSKVFVPTQTNMTGYGYSKEELENGAVAVSINGQYQEIQFNLPEEVDLSLYNKMVVTLESPNASDANALCLKVIHVGAELDQYNNPNPFHQSWGVVKYPGGDIEIDLSAHADKKVCRFTVMASAGACNVNVYRIAFVPKDGVTPPAGGDTPVVPEKPEVVFGTLPEGSKVFVPADTNMTGYGYTKNELENGAVAVSITGQYQEIQFNLPENVSLDAYDKMVVTLESASAEQKDHVTLKVITTDAELDQYNNPTPIIDKWGVAKYPGGDYEIDLSAFAGKDVCRFTVMAANGATDINVYRIAFLPKEGGSTTPDTPVEPDEPDVPGVSVKIEDPEKTTLTVGDTLQLKAVASVTGSAITWISSDEAIAIVDENGLVTAVSGGAVSGSAVTIKALCEDAFDTVELTVVAKEEEPEVPEVKTLTYKAGDLALGGYGYASRETNADGSVTTVFSDAGYLEVSFTLPEVVSLEKYASAVIEMSTTAGVFVKTFDAAPLQGQYGDLPYQEAWTNTTSSVTVDLRKVTVADYTNAGMTYEDLPGLARVAVMTLNEPTDVTVKSITFIPAE